MKTSHILGCFQESNLAYSYVSVRNDTSNFMQISISIILG